MTGRAPAASQHDPDPPPAGGEQSVAARLCWHADQIGRCLDGAAAELQVALDRAAEHAGAVIELAVALGTAPAADQGDR